MLDNDFIFSEKKSARIKRHLVFWVVYWLYFGLLHAANSFGNEKIMYFNNLPFTITESVLLLIPQMCIAYPMLEFILPKYLLKKKYAIGFLLTAILILLGGMLSAYMAMHINQQVLSFLLPEKYMRYAKRPAAVTFYMGLLVNLKGGLLCTATATGIKLMKHWFLKEQRNLQLQQQNTETQLQLLTAQVHPHFLFNTLNNIFSQTQVESPKGSKMILTLSDMLRYIIYEGRKPSVPLQQELNMVKEYIALEKIRYGNQLELHLQLPDSTEDLCIAPLLLLPFVENCFKHGTSNMLSNPWLNLSVDINGEELHMKLMNGKARFRQMPNAHSGIGIANVQARLELIYPQKHQLVIRNEEEVFVVDLTVQLEKLIRRQPAESAIIISQQIQHV